MDRMLAGIEPAGNKVPHPAVIFLVMIGVIILASIIMAAFDARVTLETADPVTGALMQTVVVGNSLLSTEGLRFMLPAGSTISWPFRRQA